MHSAEGGNPEDRGKARIRGAAVCWVILLGGGQGDHSSSGRLTGSAESQAPASAPRERYEPGSHAVGTVTVTRVRVWTRGAALAPAGLQHVLWRVSWHAS
eukprot:3347906-Rhodomonas_salina.1